jgi:hypothetical protein
MSPIYSMTKHLYVEANSNMKIPKTSFLVSTKLEKQLVKVLDFLLILDYGVDEGPQKIKNKMYICIYLESIYMEI